MKCTNFSSRCKEAIKKPILDEHYIVWMGIVVCHLRYVLDICLKTKGIMSILQGYKVQGEHLTAPIFTFFIMHKISSSFIIALANYQLPLFYTNNHGCNL